MAHLIELDDFQNGYVALTQTVLNEGSHVSPRGQATYELEDVVIVVNDPVNAIPMDVGRKLNMAIGAAETAQLVAGVSHLGQLVSATANFKMFSDDGEVLRGAYGPRISAQMPRVVSTLATDPASRQALALIWRPNELASRTNDVPCTVALQWRIRGGRLNMTTTMRSNDVYLGSPYDFWMFTRLQMAVAWALNVPLGTYTHHVGSLHVYERNVAAVESLYLAPVYSTPPLSFIAELPSASDLLTPQGVTSRWSLATNDAQGVVFGSLTQLRGTKWYADALRDHTPRGNFCPSCRYVYPKGSRFFDPEFVTVCSYCND